MNTKKSSYGFLIMLVFSISIFFSSCNAELKEGTIIVTQVTGNLENNNYVNGNSWRSISQSRIVALNSEKPHQTLKVLSDGYFSACSPQISYDGKLMVFAAQKKQNDVWQIFEMNLENLKVTQITSSTDNCIDPTFLPDGQLLYSKFTKNDTLNTSYSLYTYNGEENKTEQITYNPHAYFAPTLLHDGRILTISKQLYPTSKDAMFMVIRPDGTKEELFYKGLSGRNLSSRGYETNNGKVVFIESDSSHTNGGNIIAINYNRPIHSKVNLSSNIKGDFYAIYPQQDGKLMVTFRQTPNDHFALYEFDSDNKTLGNVIYKDENFNVLEVVVVTKRKRPRILPSEIKIGTPTALLLCQNVNESRLQPYQKDSLTSKAEKIEVLGINASLGFADVEKDGSIYLKVLANTPFRIQTLNKEGEIIYGPSSWMYLRPNERHGCVGCHADNEQTPDNIQPIAVQKGPQIIHEPVKKNSSIFL